MGVAALATRAAAPRGYAIRGWNPHEAERWLRGQGFGRVDKAAPGDVLLMRPGPGQLHLGVGTRGGFVHADLGLKRVVERPGPPEWEVLGIWRRWY